MIIWLWKNCYEFEFFVFLFFNRSLLVSVTDFCLEEMLSPLRSLMYTRDAIERDYFPHLYLFMFFITLKFAKHRKQYLQIIIIKQDLKIQMG